jgi:hypothetical protein
MNFGVTLQSMSLNVEAVPVCFAPFPMIRLINPKLLEVTDECSSCQKTVPPKESDWIVILVGNAVLTIGLPAASRAIAW